MFFHSNEIVLIRNNQGIFLLSLSDLYELGKKNKDYMLFDNVYIQSEFGWNKLFSMKRIKNKNWVTYQAKSGNITLSDNSKEYRKLPKANLNSLNLGKGNNNYNILWILGYIFLQGKSNIINCRKSSSEYLYYIIKNQLNVVLQDIPYSQIAYKDDLDTQQYKGRFILSDVSIEEYLMDNYGLSETTFPNNLLFTYNKTQIKRFIAGIVDANCRIKDYSWKTSCLSPLFLKKLHWILNYINVPSYLNIRHDNLYELGIKYDKNIMSYIITPDLKELNPMKFIPDITNKVYKKVLSSKEDYAFELNCNKPNINISNLNLKL